MNNQGFIALISAIIISAILLLVATVASLNGFYGRSNILDAEYKERSSAIADQCADYALLQFGYDSSYVPASQSVNGYSCTFKNLATNPSWCSGSSKKTFETQGYFQNAYTNLQVTVDTNDLSICEEEIANF